MHKKLPREQMIYIMVTPNEAIAMNLAISYFHRYYKHISPVYEQALVLLQQYQQRLHMQLPSSHNSDERGDLS